MSTPKKTSLLANTTYMVLLCPQCQQHTTVLILTRILLLERDKSEDHDGAVLLQRDKRDAKKLC